MVSCVQLPALFPFSFPRLPQVRCFFSTALAGNLALQSAVSEAEKDAVIATKEQYMKDFGLKAWVEVFQVHGDKMVEAPSSSSVATKPEVEADGLHTTQEGRALTIRTADCQPILIAHKSGAMVAALHNGWRGNALGYPGKAVHELCQTYHVRAADLLAVRGPSLGPRASEFINFAKEWPESFSRWFDKTTNTMNLWQLTKDQLCDAGLLPGNIFSLDLCTYSLPSLFFSHRQKHTGRQTSAIWITNK